tara:strand:- start:1870 stop:2283 length:414 start_codon:yes stop_codon:yes gene_type:complete
MSSDMTLIGNLTREPELRFSPKGVAVTKFSIAVNKGSEEKGNRTSHFFDATCFGDFAENMAELPKGTRVVLAGYMQQDKWEDKETGKNRSKHVFIANDGGPSVRFNAVKSGPSPAKVEDGKAVAIVQAAFAVGEEPF